MTCINCIHFDGYDPIRGNILNCDLYGEMHDADTEELCTDYKEIKKPTRKERIEKSQRLVAKFKPWFGAEIPDLFNTTDYEIEHTDMFVYIFKRRK